MSSSQSSRWLRLCFVVLTITEATCKTQEGAVVESLFRFNASLLGSEFADLIDAFDEWMGPIVDERGAKHASVYTAKDGPRQFHQECYCAPDKDKYLDLEMRKKMIHFQYQEPEQEMVLEHEVFVTYGTEDEGIAGAATDVAAAAGIYSSDKKWTWRSAAHFSSRGGKNRALFRQNLQSYLAKMMKSDLRSGRVSGTYWYPPGSVREWHTNKFDLVKEIDDGQPWRMYYIRIKPDSNKEEERQVEEDGRRNDPSGMHLLEGPGADREILERVGAYPLSLKDPKVWRIPDQDGFVTLFRLPELWHCIVSDSAHRFSLGFAFSDVEVQSILKRAGVPFQVEHADDHSKTSEL